MPLTLDARAVAAQARVDLGDLDVRSLRFFLEVGEGSLVLPAPSGDAAARVGVTLGRLTVILPEGVPVRIVPDSSLARIRVDEDRVPRRRGGWQSPGFEDAPRRLTLEVHATLGRVLVR